jgi:ABC-2 type transport system ATP-binding protein
VIVVDELTKRYGRSAVVDSVSFRAEPGTVTGFLGPNGAGKSSTLRMLTGLTAPTSGSSTILGRPYARLDNPGRQVGVLLDASAQHPGRSGRTALRLDAMLMGLPRRTVDDVLERVGLSDAEGDRRVGDSSLGMRQRLGLAHALIGGPQVLILDEPANGLDPAGIRWLRGLLADFAADGGTVLLSSHLLHEVELLADHLVVISRGRVVADGSRDALLSGAGTLVRAVDETALARALDAAGLASTTTPDGGRVVQADQAQVARAAATAGLAVTELRPADGSGLEALFLSLTADSSREQVSA